MATTTELQTVDIELFPRSRLEEDSDHDRSALETSSREETVHQVQELKPADGGRDAWSVLVACIVCDGLLWGFAMCFGVFQAYYEKLPEFEQDKSQIALIGTFAQSLIQLGAPVSTLASRQFPRYVRGQMLLGWICCVSSLLTASFASTVPTLVATQGILYGIGVLTLIFPAISLVNEWWVARKGMAFGLISASSGITGAGLPFILEALLARYGHRTTLRASAVTMIILTTPLIPLFRPRLPVTSSTGFLRMVDWSFFRRPLWWVYGSAVLVQGAGFTFPVIFLASYAGDIGLSSTLGALLLAIMSLSQVFGQFTFGWLSDHDNLSVSVLTTICCVVSALAALVLWGFASSLPWLVAFAILYGFFAFGFATMRVAMGRAVSSDATAVLAMYSIFVFLQGLGMVFAGPMSAPLMRSRDLFLGQYASGTYAGLVLMTGLTAATAGLIISCWHGYKGIRKVLA